MPRTITIGSTHSSTRPTPRAAVPGVVAAVGLVVDQHRLDGLDGNDRCALGGPVGDGHDDHGDVVLATRRVGGVDELRRCARVGSSSRRRIAAMSSGCTMPVRPSEQRSRRSPGASSTGYTSTSTAASTPSARVMIERCGCTAASSVVSRPSRTSSSTRLWSTVTWRSSPSCRRYARESPTCPTSSVPPATSVAAVSVVPMPRRLASVRDLVNTASLASSIDSRSGCPALIAARNASSAVTLATSPAR